MKRGEGNQNVLRQWTVIHGNEQTLSLDYNLQEKIIKTPAGVHSVTVHFAEKFDKSPAGGFAKRVVSQRPEAGFDESQRYKMRNLVSTFRRAVAVGRVVSYGIRSLIFAVRGTGVCTTAPSSSFWGEKLPSLKPHASSSPLSRSHHSTAQNGRGKQLLTPATSPLKENVTRRKHLFLKRKLSTYDIKI